MEVEEHFEDQLCARTWPLPPQLKAMGVLTRRAPDFFSGALGLWMPALISMMGGGWLVGVQPIGWFSGEM